MKQFRGTGKGFTLIELIMVITVLAALAVIAIPQYFNLQTQAQAAGEQGVVGGVRAGIMTRFANTVATTGVATFPGFLDTLDATGGNVTCSNANPCFASVLNAGVTSQWTKTGGDGAGSANDETYDGPTGTTYTYNPANGSFQ